MVQATLGAASVYKKVKVKNIDSCAVISFRVGYSYIRDIIWDLWLKVLSIPTFLILVYAFYSNHPDAPLAIHVICASLIWGLLWTAVAVTYALDVLLEDKT